MKNEPEEIYLNVGFNDSDLVDSFNELEGVSWSTVKMNDADVKYVRVDKDEFVLSRDNRETTKLAEFLFTQYPLTYYEAFKLAINLRKDDSENKFA